jgi:hypothetical protein
MLCFREVTASYLTNECASIHREISWSMSGSQKILWLPAALNPIQSMPALGHKRRSTTAMERNALRLHLAALRRWRTPDDDSRAPMHSKNVALRNRTKDC